MVNSEEAEVAGDRDGIIHELTNSPVESPYSVGSTFRAVCFTLGAPVEGRGGVEMGHNSCSFPLSFFFFWTSDEMNLSFALKLCCLERWLSTLPHVFF